MVAVAVGRREAETYLPAPPQDDAEDAPVTAPPKEPKPPPFPRARRQVATVHHGSWSPRR